MVQRALGGEKIYSLNDVDDVMARDAEAQHRDEIYRDAKARNIKTAFRKFEDVERDVIESRNWDVDEEVTGLDDDALKAYSIIVGDLRNAVGEDQDILEGLAHQFENASAEDYFSLAVPRIKRAIQNGKEPIEQGSHRGAE